MVRVGRRNGGRQRVLLSHPQPGGADRVRPSAPRKPGPARRGPETAHAAAHTRGRPHAERKRLWQRPPPPTLHVASAPGLTVKRRVSLCHSHKQKQKGSKSFYATLTRHASASGSFGLRLHMRRRV